MPAARSLNRAAAVLALVAAVVVSGIPSAYGTASSTAGDATPNFTESSSCGPYGTRGQMSPSTTLGTRIYGPYADFFGRTRSSVYGSTVTWKEPSGRTYRVHSRSLPALQDAAQHINQTGAGYRVKTGDAYAWRNVAGWRQMSQHAIGNALDINPPQNPYTAGGNLITDMPPAYVSAWKAAGFCWGGDWRFSKDSMHYSWRGPAFKNGRSIRLFPYPPLTAPGYLTVRALEAPIGLPSPVAEYTMADRRREGADDLYGVIDSGGRWQVQVAGAVSHFGVVGVRRTSGAQASGVPVLSDASGDGRADLWIFNHSGKIAADVYFDQGRFRDVGMHVVTGATWSGDAELGMAAFDTSDWLPDLYVIRRNTGKIEIYSSASGYRDKIHESILPINVGTDSIVLADRDVDGYPDLWLIGHGAQASVRIAKYSSSIGYTGSVETFNSSMTIADGAAVLPGDYDGDGRIDIYLVSNNRVSVWLGGVPDRSLSQLDTWFMPDDPNTFDAGPVCTGTCDQIGYVDRSGLWRLAHEAAWGPEETNFYYGIPSDTPFMGDWDCDGIDTPGLYRRSDGYVYLRNSNTQGVADRRYYFGIPGDVPLAGDFDGDGCDSVSIYRPSESRIYVINELGDDDEGLGAAQFSYVFGNPGDNPFVGDFDGNGADEVGLHREATGRVYFRFTLTTGVADRDFVYGIPGDLLVAGDWDGDGVDTPAIFRPSDGNWYLKLSNRSGIADHVIPFGLADRGFVPVAGHHGLVGNGMAPLSVCETCYLPFEGEPLESK